MVHMDNTWFSARSRCTDGSDELGSIGATFRSTHGQEDRQMLNTLRHKILFAVRSWQHGGLPSHFVLERPSPQHAVDIFKGEWGSKIPLEGLVSGASPLFEDERVTKLLGTEAIENKDVLELGPLEGAHSCMLEKLGARSIYAVEANARAYLKCLVTKEIMGLQRTHFLLGDVFGHMLSDPKEYDLLLAIGIVYHLRDPHKLFELASPRVKAGGRLLLWTHYWAPSVADCAALNGRFTTVRDIQLPDGSKTTLHRHEYGSSIFGNRFFGGNAPYSEWMTRDGLLQAARANGFRVEIEEDLQHSHGPSILASFRKI